MAAGTTVLTRDSAGPDLLARLRTLWPPVLGWLTGIAFVATRFGLMSGRLPIVHDFNRRDSGQYLSIASRGYWTRTVHCVAGGHRHPTLCGNVTWFPGYPAVVRALSEALRIGLPVAAVAVSWTAWLVLLIRIWRLCAGAGPARQWLCLGVAVFFPGQVYFATMFPLSLAVAAALICIEAAVEGRRPAAFLSGFVAGTAYFAMLLVAPALALVALVRRRTMAAMALGAAGLATGAAAVLLYARLSVGRWDAYFVTERETYGVGLNFSTGKFVRHLQPLWTSGATWKGRQISSQSALLLVLLAVALIGTALEWRRRRRLTTLDASLVIASVGMWMLPYVAGGDLSVYRAEGCAVLLVPLFRRLPRPVLLVLLLACVPVAWVMAGLFHRNVLG